jgi:GcrA cell cycle regulator
MSWTDERVESLKTMWIEGKSASQIAKALGGVTRNAVIGKVHRLGLSNRAASPKPAVKESPGAAAEQQVKADAPAQPKPEPAPKPQAKEAPKRPAVQPNTPQPPQQVSEVSEEARRNLEEVEKKARKLDLLQLTERTCKWPIGDPATNDFYFCGLPSQPGKPYCDAHVAVAFQPMSSRRDRARSR